MLLSPLPLTYFNTLSSHFTVVLLHPLHLSFICSFLVISPSAILICSQTILECCAWLLQPLFHIWFFHLLLYTHNTLIIYSYHTTEIFSDDLFILFYLFIYFIYFILFYFILFYLFIIFFIAFVFYCTFNYHLHMWLLVELFHQSLFSFFYLFIYFIYLFIYFFFLPPCLLSFLSSLALEQCFSNYLMWRTGRFFFNVTGTS